MRKYILIILSFIFICGANSQDTLRITINGSAVRFQVGKNPAVVMYRQVITVSWSKDSNFVNFFSSGAGININNIPINLIYINNTPANNFSNLINILGTLITTGGGSGGGGGGAVNSINGNIVSNIGGGNYVINQTPIDWNALTGLASIANKPYILDSGQIVKYRDSNYRYITPNFFF